MNITSKVRADVLGYIKDNVRFRSFALMSVREFNIMLADGNDLMADEDVWAWAFGGMVATIARIDGQWWSEITDNVERETGIAQGWGDTPEKAWEMTISKL